jgi:hypothetical protein
MMAPNVDSLARQAAAIEQAAKTIREHDGFLSDSPVDFFFVVKLDREEVVDNERSRNGPRA